MCRKIFFFFFNGNLSGVTHANCTSRTEYRYDLTLTTKSYCTELFRNNLTRISHMLVSRTMCDYRYDQYLQRLIKIKG